MNANARLEAATRALWDDENPGVPFELCPIVEHSVYAIRAAKVLAAADALDTTETEWGVMTEDGPFCYRREAVARSDANTFALPLIQRTVRRGPWVPVTEGNDQ